MKVAGMSFEKPIQLNPLAFYPRPAPAAGSFRRRFVSRSIRFCPDDYIQQAFAMFGQCGERRFC
jgi:hypothetical protein